MITDFFALRDGLPLISIQLDPKRTVAKTADQQTLISGFFQALNSFADSVNHLGSVDEIRMTDRVFAFQKQEITDSILLFVISAEENSSKMLRKAILNESVSSFLHLYDEELLSTWNGDVSKFRSFKKIFRTIVDSLMKTNKAATKMRSADSTLKLTHPFEYENNGNNIHSPNPVNLESNIITQLRANYEPDRDFEEVKFSKKEIRHTLITSFNAGMNYTEEWNGDLTKREKRHRILKSSRLIQNQKDFGEISDATYPFTTIPRYGSRIRPIFAPRTDIPIDAPYFAPPVPDRQIGMQRSGGISLESAVETEITKSSISKDKLKKFRDSFIPTESGVEPFLKIHRSVYNMVPLWKIKRPEEMNWSDYPDWIQTILKNLDGKRNIQELAKLADVNQDKVFQFCQKLATGNLVQLSR